MLHRVTMAKDTLKDISHTPPKGERVDRVWERGNERDD
jgi:hypothetical protein